MEKSGLSDKKTVKIIAHRGASKEAPENTVASIKRAIHYKVALIEIDVHLTKDHVPILIHDPDLKRLAGSPLCIKDLTLQEARSIYPQIPTLEEVLPLYRYMIELKADPGLEEALVEAVLKIYTGSHYIGSFSQKILQLIAKKAPHIPLITIAEEIEEVGPQQTVALLSPRITARLIQDLHKQGRSLFAWTVDNQEEAKRLISQGIDGIITNDPGAISVN